MLPDDAPITARAGEFSEPTESDLAAIQPVNILYTASVRRAVFPVATYPGILVGALYCPEALSCSLSLNCPPSSQH